MLNWLALAGWGTHTGPSEQGDQPSKTVKAPDSTTVMNLSEIIENVCLFLLLRTRAPVDELCSSSWMLSRTAARYWIPPSWSSSINTISQARDPQRPVYAPWRCVVKDTLKTRFLIRQYPFHVFPLFLIYMVCPCSTFNSLEYIEKIILALQGRLVTLMDLPTAAPYFFVSPAWDDAEARAMLDGISLADYQAAMQGTAARLRSTSPGDVQAIADVLHIENEAAGVKPARFMTALRHAMSGMKVSF